MTRADTRPPRLTHTARTLIRLLPEPMGIALAIRLAEWPRRAAISPSEQAAMQRATRLRYGESRRNTAWSWGEGPAVVLVHGMGGRATQLAPLGQHIATLGFRAVALDATGHGDSVRRSVNWAQFFDDIAALAHSLNVPVHAYVGHSAGGLAVMAARRLRGLQAKRYVCICSPSHPFKGLEILKRRLDPSEAGLNRYKAYIAQQFECSWEALQAGSSYAGAGSDTLLYYDERDRFIPHGEGDKIFALCQGASFIKTNAHGHNRILGQPDLARAVGAFLMR